MKERIFDRSSRTYLNLSLVKFSRGLFINTLIYGVLIISIGCSKLPEQVVSEKYQFDAKGKLLSKMMPDKSKVKYTYDERGLLAKIIYPGETINFRYDALGNRILMQNKHGKTKYKYDAFNRLTEVISHYSQEKKIKYEYDPWERISAIEILNLGNVEYKIKYNYNILGNIVSIDDGFGQIDYRYFPNKNKVVRYFPNGIKTDFSFTPMGELTELSHRDAKNRIIASYRYEYNPAGKISHVIEQIQEGQKAIGYEWDTRGYLKALRLPGDKMVRYEYDSMGNRILKAGPDGITHSEYDTQGRLVKAGNTHYEWDRNGNLSSFRQRGERIRFFYEKNNLLSSVRLPEKVVRYGYDGEGNLISRNTGKDTSYYLQNPLAPPGFTLAEYDELSRIKSTFVYGDVLLSQRDSNGQAWYFLEDGFNSIRYITDIKGKISGQRNYTPFGEPVDMTGYTACNFRTAGERFLPEIKSYAIGGRLYEPQIGRYFTPAPVPGYMHRFDTFNRYAHGCNAYGIFMEPRCNQTRKKIPDLTSYGLYSPLEHPFKTVGSIGSIPLPSGIGLLMNLPEYQKALRGKEFDITLPISASYLLGGILTQGWGSLFTIGAGLSQAPLMWLNFVLRPVLHGYWNFVFRTFEEADLRLRETTLRNYYPADLYDVDISRDRNRLTMTIKTRGFPSQFIPSGGGIGGLSGLKGDSFSSKYKDPINAIEANLAGIKLAATGEFIGNLGNIIGAVFDPDKQCIVLIGDQDLSVPSINARDLAVALMCVFGPEPQDPQFSLNPADPRNPKGKWLKAVYIPEEIIRSTVFGNALFEADWLLKQYSFGVTIDENGKCQERKSSVAGFKSAADLSLEQKDDEDGEERWARFWIVADDMDDDPEHNMILKREEDGNSIYFDTAKMRVKARKQVPDPSSPIGLRDVETDDPLATKFANMFTELYDEIAKESPEFERVRQLAKAVALAKWLKKEGIPVDMDWVFKYVNKRIKTVDKLSALSVQWKKQTQKPYSKEGVSGVQYITQGVNLFGGVDLCVNPRYISDDGKAQSLQERIMSKLGEEDTGPTFKIEHSGKSFQASVLPLTKAGQKMRENYQGTEINGITYQLDNQGEIAKSTDREGNVTEYEYDSKNKLTSVKISKGNGWKVRGERYEVGSSWTATNPNGNTYRYKYGTSSYLNEIEVDGDIWATCEFNQENREFNIRYNGYTEKITFDGSDNIIKVEIHTEKGWPSSELETEELIFDYNKSGNITEISGVGMPSVSISYAEDGFKPAKVTTPQDEIRYSYDPEGRVKKIVHSLGVSATYDYEGNQITKVKVDYSNRQVEYKFDKNGVIYSKDFLGGINDYGYSNGKLTSVKHGKYGTAEYVYDDKDRLREIHFPDGSWKEYQYQRRKLEGNPGQILNVISHPTSLIKKEDRTLPDRRKRKSSSSPLEDVYGKKRRAKKTTSPKVDNVKHIPSERMGDNLRAIESLEREGNDVFIIDLFEKGKNRIVSIYSKRGYDYLDDPYTEQFRKVLHKTLRVRGRIGERLNNEWKELLSRISLDIKPVSIDIEGKRIRINKPLLFIRSSDFNINFANLEKVPALRENFIIHLLFRNTTASELAEKIKAIPQLSKHNVMMIVRLPDELSTIEREEWEGLIRRFREVIGEESLLYNPTYREFSNFIQNNKKNVVMIEVTHTDKGIVLKGNRKFTYRDVLKMKGLHHIKYLISGIGSCELGSMDNGRFVRSLRQKGVSLINLSHEKLKGEEVIENFKILLNLLKNAEFIHIPAYRIPDLIHQIKGKGEKGVINIGKLFPVGLSDDRGTGRRAGFTYRNVAIP